jgi:hypothetical protein
MTKPLFIARQSRHPHGRIGSIAARVMERDPFRRRILSIRNPGPPAISFTLAALEAMSSFRTPFLVLGGLAVVGGWWMWQRKRGASCEADATCAPFR